MYTCNYICNNQLETTDRLACAVREMLWAAIRKLLCQLLSRCYGWEGGCREFRSLSQKYQRLGLKQQTLFSQFWSWRSVPGESCLPGSVFLTMRDWRWGDSTLGLLTRTLIPAWGLFPGDLVAQSPTSKHDLVGIWIQHMHLVTQTNSVHCRGVA